MSHVNSQFLVRPTLHFSPPPPQKRKKNLIYTVFLLQSHCDISLLDTLLWQFTFAFMVMGFEDPLCQIYWQWLYWMHCYSVFCIHKYTFISSSGWFAINLIILFIIWNQSQQWNTYSTLIYDINLSLSCTDVILLTS